MLTCSSCSETGRVLCTLRSCEIDICSLSPDVGLCRAYIPSYYFNQTLGRCERFIYGGCSGNGNRFSTNGDCLRRCSPTSELIVDDDSDAVDMVMMILAAMMVVMVLLRLLMTCFLYHKC